MFSFKKDTTLCVLFFLSMLLSTCAGKVDGPADCPVDCSNAINATVGMEIKSLTGEGDVIINCHGSVVPKVVELLFKVETSSKAALHPSISYRPVFNGSYDPSRNDHEEAEYKGIETPKDKWCSSACGVVTVNVWPQCEEGIVREHTLSVISGPVASEVITIKMIDYIKE